MNYGCSEEAPSARGVPAPSPTSLAELAPAVHEHLELLEAERSRSICVDLREETLHATPAAL